MKLLVRIAMGSTATDNTPRKSPHVRRGFLIALGCVCVLFLTVLLGRFLQRPEELEVAAYHALTAIETGDAATLMEYVSEEEARATGLDEAALQELLDRVLMPALKGFRRYEVLVAGESGEVSYMLIARYAHQDGPTTALAAHMYRGDAPVMPNSAFQIINLAVGVLAKSRHPDVPIHVGRYRVYRELRPILESLKLKSVWLSLKGRALSWEEIEQRFRDRAAKVEAAE